MIYLYLLGSNLLATIAKMFIYLYMRFTYLSLLLRVMGMETHKYSRNLHLTFEGIKPLTWYDTENNYITGLPDKINSGSITIENKNSGDKFHFDACNGKINWNDFFSNMPVTVFHDDLD